MLSEHMTVKLNVHKTKIWHPVPSLTSWQIDGETMERMTDYFLGFQNHWEC